MKKRAKRLSLHRETLRTLMDDETSRALGGDTNTGRQKPEVDDTGPTGGTVQISFCFNGEPLTCDGGCS